MRRPRFLSGLVLGIVGMIMSMLSPAVNAGDFDAERDFIRHVSAQYQALRVGPLFGVHPPMVTLHDQFHRLRGQVGEFEAIMDRHFEMCTYIDALLPPLGSTAQATSIGHDIAVADMDTYSRIRDKVKASTGDSEWLNKRNVVQNADMECGEAEYLATTYLSAALAMPPNAPPMQRNYIRQQLNDAKLHFSRKFDAYKAAMEGYDVMSSSIPQMQTAVDNAALLNSQLAMLILHYLGRGFREPPAGN